jgi:hypothetical protein
MGYEVLATVVMVCSVGTVVATTTGRNEEATQNLGCFILGLNRKVAYHKPKIKFYVMKGKNK